VSTDDDSLTLPAKLKKRHRIGVVAPTAVVAAAFAIWSGYWFFTAYQVQKRLLAEQQTLIKAGYQASIDPFAVTGYPYRMYVDLKHVTVVSPSGKGFAAPEIVAEANAYALTKWVMVAPQGLTLFRGHPGGVELGRITVTGSALRASVSRLGQPIQNIAFQGTDVALTPSDPSHPFPFTHADVFEAYTRANANAPDAADFLLRVDAARGAPGSMAGDLSPGQPVSLHAEGTLTHSSAFKGDISTGLSAWSAAGGQVSGLHMLVKAGDLSLTATSPTLTADERSRLAGHLDLELSGTYKPVDVLAGARLISPDNLALAKPLLDMTLSTGGPQKFGIDFKNGGSYIGFLKVSNAPALP
jgi:hypothetical protein